MDWRKETYGATTIHVAHHDHHELTVVRDPEEGWFVQSNSDVTGTEFVAYRDTLSAAKRLAEEFVRTLT